MKLDKLKNKAVVLALVPTFVILPLTGCSMEDIDNSGEYSIQNDMDSIKNDIDGIKKDAEEAFGINENKESNDLESESDKIDKETKIFEPRQHMVAYKYAIGYSGTALSSAMRIPQYEGYEIYDIAGASSDIIVTYVNTEEVEVAPCTYYDDEDTMEDYMYCEVGKPIQKTLTK